MPSGSTYLLTKFHRVILIFKIYKSSDFNFFTILLYSAVYFPGVIRDKCHSCRFCLLYYDLFVYSLHFVSILDCLRSISLVSKYPNMGMDASTNSYRSLFYSGWCPPKSQLQMTEFLGRPKDSVDLLLLKSGPTSSTEVDNATSGHPFIQ